MENKIKMILLLFREIFNLLVVFIFNIAFMMANTDFQLDMI